MGLILVPSEITNKSEAVKTALTGIITGYQNVLTEVSNFAHDDALQSESWTKLKEKVLEYHTYIQQGMLAVQKSVEANLKTLEGSIGSEALDEDELLSIVEGLEFDKQSRENEKASWEQMKNNAIISSFATLNSMINSKIEQLEKEIEIIVELINTYNEKLNFLYDVEASTKNLFDESLIFLTAMDSLINEAGVKNNNKRVTDSVYSVKWQEIIPDVEADISKGTITGISEKGYEFLVDLELGVSWKNADYMKLDEQGNIVAIKNQAVGDGGITVGVGIYVKESDTERIEMLKELGITWNDTEQWVSYEVVTQAYNNISEKYIKIVDGILEKYNIEATQEQYDALYAMAYNREALFSEGGAVDNMLLSGNNNMSDWRNALIEEYQALGGWQKYGNGWTNRIDDELELYFKGDYIRNHA